MFGFSVLENDELLYTVTWGDIVGIAHVENFYGAKHIKVQELYGEGKNYDIDFRKAMQFLEKRTVPRTRVNIDELLKKVYKIKDYRPLEMVKKDHGVSMTDYIWVRFIDEDITYADVRIRP